MPYTATVTPGETFPNGQAAGLPQLRAGAAPTVAVAGGPDATELAPDAFWFGAATLTGSAIAVTANGMTNVGVYKSGMRFVCLADFNCPGGALTLNFNGVGAVSLFKNVNQNLGLNDFLDGQAFEVCYDGANMQLMTRIDTGGSNQNVAAATQQGANDQASFSATALILGTPAGGTISLLNVNVAGVNITAATPGAGGLDTGTATTSTWYYLWCIFNGTTVAGMFSLSNTAPALPTGYYAMALLCPVYYVSSGVLTYQQVRGRTVYIETVSAIATTPGSANTYAESSSLAAFLPPIALTVTGTLGLTGNGTSNVGGAVAGDANGTGAQYVAGSFASIAGDATGIDALGTDIGNFTIPLLTAQKLWYKSIIYTSDATAGAPLNINLSAYTF